MKYDHNEGYPSLEECLLRILPAEVILAGRLPGTSVIKSLERIAFIIGMPGSPSILPLEILLTTPSEMEAKIPG